MNREGKKVNPILESVLKNDVCQYIPDYAYDCQIATKNGQLGLLSINDDYVQTASSYLDLFEKNPTSATVKALALPLAASVSSGLTVLKNIYPFLIDYVLGNFGKIVDSSLHRELVLFSTICALIIFYALLIRALSFKKLEEYDLCRRFILKIVPYNMLQNKVLAFYIVSEFGSESREVRNIL